MYIVTGAVLALGWTASVSSYTAPTVVDQLSFGNRGKLSDDGHSIPGWHISGEGHTPQLVSDRIVLTPPYPGNKRGAVWASQPIDHDQWEMEIDFRASGPDRGSGNMQVWYAFDGESRIGMSSIYTIGQFEGLVLVIDQYAGHGGSVRGFLNDGTKSFKDHHHVDSLAFGQCTYSYRNKGHFAKLLVKQTHEVFEVTIDGHPCFKTHKVRLPTGYSIGVTAASAENPDSFEVSKFLVHDHEWAKDPPKNTHNPAQHREEHRDPHKQPPPPPVHDAPSVPASSIKGTEAQFADLHDRISDLQNQLTHIVHDITALKQEQTENHEEVIHRILMDHDMVDDIHHIIHDLEANVKAIKDDVEGKDYKQHLERLHAIVAESHASMMNSMPNTVAGLVTERSRMGFFVFIIIAFQAIFGASYIVYKRRLKNSHQKYL
ncbi:putative lectin family integral membrane protein [Aulographum hederae CBS 113979]|uniref:Putative lectin family integral membrane protein n=1 Tax=Aulographum hederae CBS 113979 TaxID=1176131 RepID=A0A6G1GYH2_9PEZI|nr:putative lectin family integral membrane protein [Aulographum hederae CBS 113979]